MLGFEFLNVLKYSSFAGLFFGITIGLNMPGRIHIEYKYGNKKRYLKTIAPIFIGGIFGIIFSLSIIALPFSFINSITQSSYADKLLDNILKRYTIEMERCYQWGEKLKYDYPSILCIKFNSSKNDDVNDVNDTNNADSNNEK